MMGRKILVLALVLCLAGFLTSCGKDEGPTVPEVPAQTAAEIDAAREKAEAEAAKVEDAAEEAAAKVEGSDKK